MRLIASPLIRWELGGLPAALAGCSRRIVDPTPHQRSCNDLPPPRLRSLGLGPWAMPRRRSLYGRFLHVATGCFWLWFQPICCIDQLKPQLISAGRHYGVRLVRSNKNDCSVGMQSTGRWGYKWVVKSMQLRKRFLEKSNILVCIVEQALFTAQPIP